MHTTIHNLVAQGLVCTLGQLIIDEGIGSHLNAPMTAPPPIRGFDLADLLFLSGVLVVWHLVGRALDARFFGTSASGQRNRPLYWLRFLSLAVGISLFGVALGPMRSQSFNNGIGHTAEVILVLTWPIALHQLICEGWSWTAERRPAEYV